MTQTTLILSLPVWIESFLNRRKAGCHSPESRMELVIALGIENVKRKTGGPFAAAVFNSKTGKIISAGVNRVVPCSCSIAHAEMMALGLAQQSLNTFTLSAEGIPELELVTSTEPCAMCLGAIPWAGIKRVICGATDADARAAGFDEGVKPADWVNHLSQLGIEVRTSVCRDDATRLLKEYSESGLPIYNGHIPLPAPD